MSKNELNALALVAVPFPCLVKKNTDMLKHNILFSEILIPTNYIHFVLLFVAEKIKIRKVMPVKTLLGFHLPLAGFYERKSYSRVSGFFKIYNGF